MVRNWRSSAAWDSAALARTARHRLPGAHPLASEDLRGQRLCPCRAGSRVAACRRRRTDATSSLPLNLQDQDVVVVVVRDETGGLRRRDVGVHLRREIRLHLKRSGQCSDRPHVSRRRRRRRWCSRRQSHRGCSRIDSCHRPAGLCPEPFLSFPRTSRNADGSWRNSSRSPFTR